MKKIVRAITAFLLAGSAFFLGGFSFGRVRKNVCVNGVEIGNMPYSEAENAVRAHICEKLPSFTVHTPQGDFSFALSFTDNLSLLVRSARAGDRLAASVQLQWLDAEERLAEVCALNACEAVEARLSFSARGFSYIPERRGTACDYEGLKADVFAALSRGETEATLRTFAFDPAVTEEGLRASTRLISSYSTQFDATNAPRSHNITLAAERISGTVIPAGGEFSFNETVGKRTKENGFEEAAVIQAGEYVQGVGGGVCQASTTLMNAALRAGLNITESRPHSLSVGYVPPSCDAMVSEYSDLKFVNPYDTPVYLLARSVGGRVTFSFYGLPDGRRYEVESKVLLRVPPPPEQVVEGEEDRVLRNAKEGIASESYLLVYEGETLLSRTRLRRDTYAVVQGVRQVKRAEEPVETEEAPEEENTQIYVKFR